MTNDSSKPAKPVKKKTLPPPGRKLTLEQSKVLIETKCGGAMKKLAES